MARQRRRVPAVAAALLVLGCWSTAAPAAGDLPVVTPGTAGNLAVTVTGDGRALVREERTVTLPAGESELVLGDLPAELVAASVQASFPKGHATLLDQCFVQRGPTWEALLRERLGRSVAWIQEDGRRVTGTLVSLGGGRPLFRVGDDLVTGVPGRLVLPYPPGGLPPAPVLRWHVRCRRDGKRTLRLTYLTGGLSWRADYVLTLDREGRTGTLHGWATLVNTTTHTFHAARWHLLAGRLHRVSGGVRPLADQEGTRALGAPAMAPLAESPAGSYHLYSLAGTADLAAGTSRQLSLVTAAAVPVTRHLTAPFSLGWRRGGRSGEQRLPVQVTYRLVNDRDHHLGRPLPAGVVRVRTEQDGSPVPLGEDRLPHWPVGESAVLHTGVAFDLTARAVMVASRQLDRDTVEQEWRVTARNAASTTAHLELRVSVSAARWEMVRARASWEKVDAGTFRFPLTLPAGGEEVVNWTVRLYR